MHASTTLPQAGQLSWHKAMHGMHGSNQHKTGAAALKLPESRRWMSTAGPSVHLTAHKDLKA
eukprot:325574-Pelagomonas_calceolata.AAC.3